jgi:ribosomal protein S4
VDVLLVERGLAESRTKAQALVMAGAVVVDDARVDKPGALVAPDAAVRLKPEATLRYVSRGAGKLERALERISAPRPAASPTSSSSAARRRSTRWTWATASCTPGCAATRASSCASA